MTTPTEHFTRSRYLIMKYPGEHSPIAPPDLCQGGICHRYLAGRPRRHSVPGWQLVGSVAVRGGGAALLGRLQLFAPSVRS